MCKVEEDEEVEEEEDDEEVEEEEEEEDEGVEEEERRGKKYRREGKREFYGVTQAPSPTKPTRQQLPISINLISTKSACDCS